MKERRQMLILTREDVRRAAAMPEIMEAVAAGFAQLSSRQADIPPRPRLEIPAREAVALIMPAYLRAHDQLGVKLLTLFPHNPEQGLPAIAALVALFDSANGQPLVLMDGGLLTALRTGAASGVATRLMARAEARTLALFGAGAQALPQVWAVCEARKIERVWLVNRTAAHAERLAEELRAFGPPIPQDVCVASSAGEALAGADVVCCATGSATPLFDDGDLRAGTHINGIGSYRASMREIPGATVARARVIVDKRAAAWAEAGELALAREEGLIGAEHVAGELGEVVAGRVAGRTDDSQITLFKSVGNAAQDVAAAHVILARAREMGLGTAIDL
jgi:ornithine cyclodeaminase/alanine dehydrogenase-like protein (mu-crystallin family)